jgi:hypothetical protein
MKQILLLTIIFAVFVVPCLAQEEKQANTVCIELKNANLSVTNNQVLVAGELSKSKILKIQPKLDSHLSVYIAMAGGLQQPNASKRILVFNCSPNSETAENVTIKNHTEIRRGIEPDLEIKGGEIIIALNKNSKEISSVLPLFEPGYGFGCGIYIQPKSH